MERLPSFDSNIPAIYFIANSPLALYNLMRENIFVYETLAGKPAPELIEEFQKRVSTPITTSSEIAEIYAIFVALTFKPKTEVESFFQWARSIRFEWFQDIANLFLNNYVPEPTYQTIVVSPYTSIEQQIGASGEVSFTNPQHDFHQIK
jgi:hypothetical protein